VQFRAKGRIHRHIGTLLGSARAGAEAGRRFEADKKAAAAPEKNSATPSPKKAKHE
jgi:hypothetical protein